MLIYLYGPEDFLIRRKIKEIIGEYKKKYPMGLNIFRFDEDNFNLGKLQDYVRNRTFFEGKTLIVLENIVLPKNFRFIDPDIVWVIQQKKLDPGLLKRADRKQEFKSLEKKQNPLVFKAIDKLAERDKKSALRLFQELLAQGEDEIYLFSMIIYQWRNLLKLKTQNSKLQTLKMHPYVFQKTKKQSEKFALDELKNQYKFLAELDFQIKTGQKDAGFALDYFILKV